jgi:hypothetical protein
MEIILYHCILLFVYCIYTTHDAETKKKQEVEEN